MREFHISIEWEWHQKVIFIYNFKSFNILDDVMILRHSVSLTICEEIHKSQMFSPYKEPTIQMYSLLIYRLLFTHSPDSKFMGPTWGPPGAERTQVGPMLAPWTLLSGSFPSCQWFLSMWCHCNMKCIHWLWQMETVYTHAKNWIMDSFQIAVTAFVASHQGNDWEMECCVIQCTTNWVKIRIVHHKRLHGSYK